MTGTCIAEVTPPPGAVAFAIVLEDGTMGVTDWALMDKFDWWQPLPDGCRYVFAFPAPQWRPIAEAPCDDTAGLACSVLDGGYDIIDFDHDSAYWAGHGLTHWMPLPPLPESTP